MASANIAVNDDCIHEFNNLKLKKHCQSILYKIIDKKEVVIETIGEKDE